MKLELIKQTKVNGEIYHIIKINGSTENLFIDYDKALEYYNYVIKREHDKKESSSEVLLSEEI